MIFRWSIYLKYIETRHLSYRYGILSGVFLYCYKFIEKYIILDFSSFLTLVK